MRDTSQKLLPESVAPELRCDTVDQGGWDLDSRKDCRHVVLVFYRGHHSQSCKIHLQRLNKLASDFADLQAELIAISGDGRDLAQQTKSDWKLDHLALGCSLQEFQMNAWGLFVSDGMGKQEPTIFNEPAAFVLEPTEKKLKYVAVASGPLGRPAPEDILETVRSFQKATGPARGSHYNPALIDTL